jgi:hypothetical protein
MWLLAILLVITTALGYGLQGAEDDDSRLAAASAAAVAETMAAYRVAAIDYARSHPGFDGVLPETALVLPAWMRHNASLSCVVSAGTVAVYFGAGATAGVVDAMDRLSQHSLLVGVARRATGTLWSPNAGDTGIAVPRAVPEGAPTWLADARGALS